MTPRTQLLLALTLVTVCLMGVVLSETSERAVWWTVTVVLALGSLAVIGWAGRVG